MKEAKKDYIFIDQSLNQLRQDIRGDKAWLYKQLLDQCDKYRLTVLPETHPEASTTFMGIAIVNLSLAYLLNSQKQYLDEAKRWAFTVVSYPHWGNAHLIDVDLSASWILFGLSIFYDWLKEDLNDSERKLVKDKLALHADKIYQFKVDTTGHGWSTNFWQNHNWINMTGLAAAGYALAVEEKMAIKWTEMAKENFDYVYSHLSEDGSNYEGVVYWRYGAMWLFIYAHLLREREGIDYFKTCKHLENTFYFRLYQSAPNLEEQVNFGDCHDRRSGHSTAIYYKVASEYNNPYAQKIGNLVTKNFLFREQYESQVKPGILAEVFFALLFYNSDVEEKDFSDLPLVKYFEDLGLVVIKDSWDPNGMSLSFKASYPGGKTQWKELWKLYKEKGYNSFGLSHQHPDNNSFILIDNQTYHAIDDGYNRNVRAIDHNTIIVDGEGYKNEGVNNIWKEVNEDTWADIETFVDSDYYVYAVGESGRNYKAELEIESFKRHLFYSKQKYFILWDRISSPKEHTYTWVMNSDVYPEVTDNSLVYQNGLGKLKVVCPDTENLVTIFSDNTIKAVMTTQEPDKFTVNPMKATYRSNRDKRKTFEFFHLFIPTTACDAFYETEAFQDDSSATFIVRGEDWIEEIIIKKYEAVVLTYKGLEYPDAVALFVRKNAMSKTEEIEVVR